MSDKYAPPPPLFEEVIRKAHGVPKTLTQEMYEQFDARLKANGGKLVPLGPDDIAPPPPDMETRVKLHAARMAAAKKEKK